MDAWDNCKAIWHLRPYTDVQVVLQGSCIPEKYRELINAIICLHLSKGWRILILSLNKLHKTTNYILNRKLLWRH